VVVRLNVNEGVLAIHVIDDGRGIPADFQLADATGLGLSIVRTLVTTELAGTIEMRPATAQELKEVELTPQADNTGTVIALRVPLENE
jgi:two-component sensor histidine kinase